MWDWHCCLQWSFTEVGQVLLGTLNEKEITNELSKDPRSSSSLHERSMDVSWLVDVTPLSFTVDSEENTAGSHSLRSGFYSLHWTKMITTFCVLPSLDFSGTSDNWPPLSSWNPLFFLRVRDASPTQRSFVGFSSSIFLYPVLSRFFSGLFCLHLWLLLKCIVEGMS